MNPNEKNTAVAGKVQDQKPAQVAAPPKDAKAEKRAKAITLIAETTAKGKDAFYWEQLAKEVITIEGIEVGDRMDEAASHAGRAVRGVYPNRDNVWKDPFTIAQHEHILGLIEFEVMFTISRRPVAPKEEPVAKGGKKGATSGAPTPPELEAARQNLADAGIKVGEKKEAVAAK